tara:strand:+ start:3829 stop:4740 length:912 start_codon:yes stop_codon:yes gene_type:complete
MDKSWTQLETRCKLFEDYDSYITLLKDAECELANKCSLFKTKVTIYFSETDGDYSVSNAFKLPSHFKNIISVHINGDLITQKDKSQWSFENSEAQAMSVPTGDPDHYTIANGFIVFDKTTTTGYADIYFRATLPNSDKIAKSVLMIPTGDNGVYLDTTMGAEIDGLTVQYPYTTAFNQKVNLAYSSSANAYDIFNPSQKNRGNATTSEMINVEYQYYQGGDWDVSLGAIKKQTTGEILNYRSKGPVIDNDYHLSLCDYAIYIATALTDPVISDKHRILWEKTIKETIDDNLDKELPVGMKEEI